MLSFKKNSISLGLVVLEEKLFTRTPTPQSDDIKMCNCSSFRENCVTNARTDVHTWCTREIKSIAMATAVTKNLQKSIITTLVVPLARNIS